MQTKYTQKIARNIDYLHIFTLYTTQCKNLYSYKISYGTHIYGRPNSCQLPRLDDRPKLINKGNSKNNLKNK